MQLLLCSLIHLCQYSTVTFGKKNKIKKKRMWISLSSPRHQDYQATLLKMYSRLTGFPPNLLYMFTFTSFDKEVHVFFFPVQFFSVLNIWKRTDLQIHHQGRWLQIYSIHGHLCYLESCLLFPLFQFPGTLFHSMLPNNSNSMTGNMKKYSSIRLQVYSELNQPIFTTNIQEVCPAKRNPHYIHENVLLQ